MNNEHCGRDQGFTLVEIVIAIVLVGILSAVAVVGIGALTEKGSDAACTSSLDAAKAGAVVYLASHAAYPPTMLAMTSSSPEALTLPDGVTLNAAAVGSNAPGTIATGENWTLTMTPGTGGGAPHFSCGAGSGVGAPSGTTAAGTTACPGPYAGWVGEYHANQNLTGSPALCRNDADVNFHWGGGSPASGIPADHFSARWTKTVTFTAGTYNFTDGSDDGGRLYLDGVLVVNYWNDRGYGTTSGSTATAAGTHTLVMEFYENGGGADATLTWA